MAEPRRGRHRAEAARPSSSAMELRPRKTTHTAYEENETMTTQPTAPEPSRPALDADRNRQLMIDYLENAWNRQDWAYSQRAVHPEAVFHDQVREGLPPGHEGLRQAMHRVFDAVPDFRVRITLLVCEDDLTTVIFEGSGTHTGTFMGYPATGRPVTFHSISVVRWNDEGQIIEGWQEADQMGMAQSIGMMPSGSMPKPMAVAMSAATRMRDRFAKRR